MYSGTLKRQPFVPDPASFHHAREREDYIRKLREMPPTAPFSAPGELTLPHDEGKNAEKKPESLARLLEMVSPEDSALIALIVFLLCDNTENDVVLLGILLYVLLSK